MFAESVPDDFNVDVISAVKKQIVLAVTITFNPQMILSVIEVGVLQGPGATGRLPVGPH